MQFRTGNKTTRAQVSSRGRNPNSQQTVATKSFYEKLSDEYFNANTSKISSTRLHQNHQPSYSPAKRNIIVPSSTKNTSEYYTKDHFRSKDGSLPNSGRKRGLKNNSLNSRTETSRERFPPVHHDSSGEISVKPSSISENTPVSSSKLGFSLKLNKNLESLKNDLNSKDALVSLESPKVRLVGEGNSHNKTPRAGDYYTANKLKKSTSIKVKDTETSATFRDSSVQNESRATASVSIPRSSVANEPKWENLKLPVDADYVLQNFSACLSPYEKEEITKYSQIYFASDIYHKILAREEKEYEDERGDYLVVKNDHIRYRYEALEMMGRGSFGQVVKVFDHKRKEYAALKVIRSPKKFHYQAKIEIRVLKYMMENYSADYNVIGLRDYFTFRNHVCLVFDLMDVNLYDLLKKNKFKGFPPGTVRKFAIQILYALKFLRHHKIIHCDLKPENILLKQPNRTGIKLIDFGSSCFEDEKLYTYIQSRFYRSPEIILGLPYSTQIDMWSFGCLLCELYLGYPVFAGDSERDQLFNIFEVLGVPDRDMIDRSPNKGKYFDEDLNPIVLPNTKGKLRHPDATPIASFIKQGDEKLLDLILNCFEFDPDKRFNPDQALAHEWIVEGLPPQLQSQHLKFIKDTTLPDEANTKRTTSTKNSFSRQGTKTYRTEDSISQTSERAQLERGDKGVDKSTSSALSTKNITTIYDEKSLERNFEPVQEESSPITNQKKFMKKKLTDLQKEKLSLKLVSQYSNEVPKTSSTKNITRSGSGYEKDPESSQKVGSTAKKQFPFNSEFYIGSLRKSGKEKEDPKQKSSLVAWESANRSKLVLDEEKSIDMGKVAKGSQSYSSQYSPRPPKSIERQQTKGEKAPVYSPYKMSSMLPNLKSSTSVKKFKF